LDVQLSGVVARGVGGGDSILSGVEEAAAVRGVKLRAQGVGEIQSERHIAVAREACCREILPPMLCPRDTAKL